MSREFRQPYFTETLSSYLAAWRGHFSVKRQVMMDAISAIDHRASISLAEDPDFPRAPRWTSAVATVTHIPREVLQELARPHAFGYLKPKARTNACMECLPQATSIGQQYRRHDWAVATVTLCYEHEMPLVEVPAVGWEWCELPWRMRFDSRGSMRYPERRAQAVMNHWAKLGKESRDLIRRAEVDLLTFDPLERQFRRLSEYPAPPDVVWRDVLTLLCASWRDFSAPSLATLGVPFCQFGQRGVGRLGGHRRPVLLDPPTFDYFCAIGDPAERRACVLMAWLALHRRSSLAGPPGKRNAPRWRRIVEDMPVSAWTWLSARASTWPARWPELANEWRLMRVRAQREV